MDDVTGLESFDRLVLVDQRPIGRTPRSNLATYTGMFDVVRKLFAATDEARARGYAAGRFSFNVAQGRCETCQGEGFVAVELLFLPGTYAACPTCQGARYNAETLEVGYRGKNVAEVLAMTVDEAAKFLADVPAAVAEPGDAARRGAGLPAARPARHRAQRRRGPADQAGHRAAAGPSRARALPARRADRGAAPGGHRPAAAAAAPAGRRRQHGRPGRARPRHDRHRRLGHRPRPGRRGRGRAGHRDRDTGGGGRSRRAARPRRTSPDAWRR